MATGPTSDTVNDWQTVAEPNDWQTVGAVATPTTPGVADPHPNGSSVGNFLRGGLGFVKNAWQNPSSLLQIPSIGATPTPMVTGKNADAVQKAQTAAVTQNATDLEAQKNFAKENPAYFAGSVILPALATHGIGKVAGKVPAFGRSLTENLTGTTPRVAKTIATDTAAENVAAAEKAAKTNESAAEQRKVDLGKHFEKTQETKAANTAAETGPARKEALTRGVEQLDVKFKDDLKALEGKTRAQANSNYNSVRAATANESVPSSELANAVKTAESKISGSSENVKQFRDILSKYPENDPDFVDYQGAQISRGHALYDVLKEQGAIGSKPATFNDLQGYYSELGDKLSTGNLPGDVYQAMKSLQESIGGLMQGMADKVGAGDQLHNARSFYRDYMQTFREPRSPVYRAIKAGERGKSIAALAGKDQTGVAAIAKYDPELAQRANTIRGYQGEAKALPSKAGKLKALPKLEPKEPSVGAVQKKIGTEDIREAKLKSLQKSTEKIRNYTNRAAFYITGYRSLVAIGRAFAGDPAALSALPADLAEGAAIVAGGNGLARLLESPRVSRLLTEPTARDIAEIPPDMRGDLSGIVQAAQKQGIKVSPALIAAIQGGNVTSKRVGAALPPQQ